LLTFLKKLTIVLPFLVSDWCEPVKALYAYEVDT